MCIYSYRSALRHHENGLYSHSKQKRGKKSHIDYPYDRLNIAKYMGYVMFVDEGKKKLKSKENKQKRENI